MSQLSFSFQQICAGIDPTEEGKVTIRAVKRAVRTLTADGGRVALADVMHAIRREAGKDAFDRVSLAVRELATSAGISDANVWRLIGRMPLDYGYNDAKWEELSAVLKGPDFQPYGANAAGLDERAVEYPWLFDRIVSQHPTGEPLLDAGSVMNYPPILAEWDARKLGPLSILTLCYEGHADPSDLVRYEFSDLRRLPYRDGWFSTVLSISTLEHVGMDTAIYGGDTERADDPEAEMMLALRELDRVTAPGGRLLISVPFGIRDDRGWLRVLDLEEVNRIGTGLSWTRTSLRILRAFETGWREVTPEEAADAGYNEPYNPPGRQTAPYWVAAAEAVALLEFRKTR